MADNTMPSGASHLSTPTPWSSYPATMTCSPVGRKLIKDFEGLRLEAYGDVTGIMTIGYGHTHNVRPGMKISADLAEAYLTEDIQDVCTEIGQTVSVQLSQNQYDALCSWIFNLGKGAWYSSGALRHLNLREYDTASTIMCLYNHAGGRVVAGLTRRRQAERALWFTPDTEKATKP